MIREERQEEAGHAYIDSDGKAIIYACPRFGKIKVTIDILKKRGYVRPAIIAPRIDIESGWINDFRKWGYDYLHDFYTFRSIDKISKEHDIYIIDEPHELSVNQQVKLAARIPKDSPILGLTGTMTMKTENELYDNLGINICYKYTIAQGVEEGIIADYLLHIHKVHLEWNEAKEFRKWDFLKNKDETSTLSKYFFELKQINILQNSLSKLQKTRELIEKYEDERVLIFCGVTKIADQLGVPVYHSKKREKQIFDDFCNGIGNHLATIQMMQAGITVVPIDRGIVNYMSGAPEASSQKICRLLGKEIFNPSKVAEVDIVVSNEQFELSRIKTALSFFDSSKIIYEN